MSLNILQEFCFEIAMDVKTPQAPSLWQLEDSKCSLYSYWMHLFSYAFGLSRFPEKRALCHHPISYYSMPSVMTS